MGSHSDNGVWTEYDLPGGGCLALFKHPDPKAAAAPGGASIAFEVEDLDVLVARLKSEGVKFMADNVQIAGVPDGDHARHRRQHHHLAQAQEEHVKPAPSERAAARDLSRGVG